MARLIGWREWVSLPDLGVDRVKVKVDTGARTSVIHAYQLQSFLEDGEEWVTFGLHPIQDNTALAVECRAKVKEHRTVRDSGGHEETRVVIETSVSMGGEVWPVELTLTDRENMTFRMLLGRTAIVNRFYVDPAQSFLMSDLDTIEQGYQEEE